MWGCRQVLSYDMCFGLKQSLSMVTSTFAIHHDIILGFKAFCFAVGVPEAGLGPLSVQFQVLYNYLCRENVARAT